MRHRTSAATPAVAATPGVRAAADRLVGAARTGSPCAPVRDLLPEASVAAGYEVQRLLTEERLAAGRRIVGHKIGLTSPAVQAQLKVDQPDFGLLFDDMLCPQDGPIDVDRLLQPRIEAEIAFVLGADLTDPAVTAESARAAVREVVPALEIVDSRIAGWDITIVDTVADNASSGLYVLGADRWPLGDRDLTTVTMRLTDGTGEVLSEGTGAACLGDPVLALVWLAGKAIEVGSPLRAGDVVLSGALGPMVPVHPATTYVADLGGLGTVRATFGERTR